MTTIDGAAARMQIDPKQAVLDTLLEEALLPVELMDRLEREKHLSDSIAKDAIWALMNNGEIELTSDHKLRHVKPLNSH